MVFLLAFSLVIVCLQIVTSVPISRGTSPKWIDLSYTFIENETIYWPSIKTFKLKRIHWGPIPQIPWKIFITFSNFETGEHGGTHMDAPVHFNERGQTVDQVPLESMIGDAVVINISAKAEQDPDYQLSVSDLEEWEKEHGGIPNHSIVFLYTGYGKYWPNKEKYFGTNTTTKVETFHFPGMHHEACKWLIYKRKLKMYGVDVASLDYGAPSDLPIHRELARNNIPGIENVANLHLLPAKGAEIIAAPMKNRNGSGGPCRLFARIAERKVVNGGASGVILNSAIISLLIGICALL